jgi:hypothetical protein
VGDLSDEIDGEALVIVPFDEVIEVHAQELELDAEMASKDKGVHYFYDLSFIPFLTKLEDADFHETLIEEPALILDDFDTAIFLSFQVEALYSLPEGTSPKVVNDLISISDVVFQDDSVVSF